MDVFSILALLLFFLFLFLFVWFFWGHRNDWKDPTSRAYLCAFAIPVFLCFIMFLCFGKAFSLRFG